MQKKFDVVGLGTCGVDLVVKVSKLPSPNNKVTAPDFSVSPGGVTANNIVQASKLELKTAWIGTLGNDEWRKYSLEKLREEKINCFDITINKYPTQQYWIVIDPKGEWSMVGILGATRRFQKRHVGKYKEIISQTKHLHLEVSGMPLAPSLEGARIAHKSNTKVLVDIDNDPWYLIEKEKTGTKKEFLDLLKLTDVAKLSKTGALGLTKEKHFSKGTIKKITAFGPEVVVITLAEGGCFVGTKEKIIHCPGFKVKSVDTVGAGDAFMGGLSYGFIKNWSFEKIGRFANACGAFKCTKFGTRASGNLREITNFLGR